MAFASGGLLATSAGCGADGGRRAAGRSLTKVTYCGPFVPSGADAWGGP